MDLKWRDHEVLNKQLRKLGDNTLLATFSIAAYDFTKHYIESDMVRRAYDCFFDKLCHDHINEHLSLRYSGRSTIQYYHSALREYFNMGLLTALAVGNVEDWANEIVGSILIQEDHYWTFDLIYNKFLDLSEKGDPHLQNIRKFFEELPLYNDIRDMEEYFTRHDKEKHEEYFREDRFLMLGLGYCLPYIISEELAPAWRKASNMKSNR